MNNFEVVWVGIICWSVWLAVYIAIMRSGPRRSK